MSRSYCEPDYVRRWGKTVVRKFQHQDLGDGRRMMSNPSHDFNQLFSNLFSSRLHSDWDFLDCKAGWEWQQGDAVRFEFITDDYEEYCFQGSDTM
jgi:hypothetical protein